MVRRHEKDYLLRYKNKDDALKYRERNIKEIAGIKGAIENSSIGIEDKALLTASLDAYEGKFLELIAEDDNIRALTATMRDSIHQTEPKISGIASLTRSLAAERQTALNQEVKEARMQALILGAVAVVIGCILSIILSRSINTPLKKVVEVAEAMAEGDLTRVAAMQRKDEIGRLSMAVGSGHAESAGEYP